MTTTHPTERRSDKRLHTIGAVCARMQAEFPDISISKIRYLEDQGLLTPKRTRGGYRLFSEEDVERLETILRLQRDEFLPLRVIKQELAAGAGASGRRRRRHAGLGEQEAELDLAELCERAAVDAALARALEEYGLLTPRIENGERLYREGDSDIAAACGRLAQYGIDARHRGRSVPATCGRSRTRPAVKRGCSSSSSRRPSARGTRTGAKQASTICRRSQRPRRSCRGCSSGASSASWPSAVNPRAGRASGPFRGLRDPRALPVHLRRKISSWA
jgi:DNA-binding transcriptional MerR regulator